MSRLRTQSENAKIYLSDKIVVEANIRDLVEDGTEFKLALDRTQLEELLQEKFDRSLELVQ